MLPDMFDHVGVEVSDVEASATLFSSVLAPLGITEAMRFPAPGMGTVVGFAGPDGRAQFWLSFNDKPARETHLAFEAGSRAKVDEVYAAAQQAGAEILHAPAVHPEYHEHYYGVFFRDLDGNNIEAVCHLPE